ncbi:MAG: hypothetical protein IJU67_06875, partial [Lachnospiraceae bacterium]|nr:hypothetical protein [Lachnospiraceae bacterium]
AADAETDARLRELEERIRHMQGVQDEKDEMIRILREQNELLRSAPAENAAKKEAYEPAPAEEEIAEPVIDFETGDGSEAETPEPIIEFETGDGAEEEIAEPVIDFESEGGEEETFSDTEDAEEDLDEDEDFMSALSSYTSALEQMTVFARMRSDGETVMRITLDDLTKAVNAKREQGSYF